MAKVYGTIGSFSELMNKMGDIYEPASFDDIIAFRKNFTYLQLRAKKEIKEELMNEIISLRKKLDELYSVYDIELAGREELLKKEQKDIKEKINVYSVPKENIFQKIHYRFVLDRLFKRKCLLENYLEEEKRKPLKKLEKTISSLKEEINFKETNIERMVEKKAESRIERLNAINLILNKNITLYMGAIGEKCVLNKLKKLPDCFSVINNFRRSFKNGIHQKTTNDWIYSVQIDNIVVGPTGIFIIEVKNWSRRSINNGNFFSPVKQVKRANHALFCYLNDSLRQGYLPSFKDNWGLQKISPKSVVVNMNKIPGGDFQFVKILSPDEVVGYLTYGNKVFSQDQVTELTNFLNSREN